MVIITMLQKILNFISPLVIICFACASDEESYQPAVNSIEEEPEITSISFLALGDSYTIGQGVSQESSWPYQLRDSLKKDAIAVDTLTVIARTGWTTKDLITAIADRSPSTHNFVSLLIGVNNQYQNKPFSQFTEEFNILLQKAIALANGSDNVILVSIPDYGVTPFGSNNAENIAQELDKYNDYVYQKAQENNISYIDVTSISRALGDSENALADDNLHPSAYQYSKWVEKILDVLRKKITH